MANNDDNAATGTNVSASESPIARESLLQEGGREVFSPRVLACCGGMVIVAGLERMTFEVLRVLKERGATIHCVVNSWENHRIVALAEQIGASWSIGSYRVSLDRSARKPLKLAQMLRDVATTSFGLLYDAWRFYPTHVLMPEFKSVLRNAPALAVLRLLGVRVVLRLGNAPPQGLFYRRVWRWLINPFVNHFVCNSDFTRRELLAHGTSPLKVSRIYNAVPTRPHVRREEVRRDRRRVIYVGQIIPDKGVDLLLDAVGMLVVGGDEAHLDIVGQIDGWESPAYGGYRERVLARVKERDLAGRVRFLGYREDVPSLLADAGLHCCPSRPELREGFGVVILEAKEAGIPSVVFRTGALAELIEHRHDGWICPKVSAEALAEGLRYFLRDEERMARAGRAAHASLVRFSREQFADGWWGIFGGQRGGRSAQWDLAATLGRGKPA
jgi:glycosyltransferase involved in cell wall biosynthesis